MDDPTATVRQGYDRWASIYDHEPNPLQALEGPLMRSAVGDPSGLSGLSGRSVLDLGCGTGRHSLWLAAAGAIVTGVDFSGEMLAQARAKPGADAVRFLTHDLREPLPFQGSTFDLVVSGLVLEHLRELGPFFCEANRVTKPGGRAIISTMHPAMFLRGTQARFTDPVTGDLVQPGSLPHSISAFILAALHAGFALTNAIEVAPDATFAADHPRATKYVDWPMLLLLSLERPVR